MSSRRPRPAASGDAPSSRLAFVLSAGLARSAPTAVGADEGLFDDEDDASTDDGSDGRLAFVAAAGSRRRLDVPPAEAGLMALADDLFVYIATQIKIEEYPRPALERYNAATRKITMEYMTYREICVAIRNWCQTLRANATACLEDDVGEGVSPVFWRTVVCNVFGFPYAQYAGQTQVVEGLSWKRAFIALCEMDSELPEVLGVGREDEFRLSRLSRKEYPTKWCNTLDQFYALSMERRRALTGLGPLAGLSPRGRLYVLWMEAMGANEERFTWVQTRSSMLFKLCDKPDSKGQFMRAMLPDTAPPPWADLNLLAYSWLPSYLAHFLIYGGTDVGVWRRWTPKDVKMVIERLAAVPGQLFEDPKADERKEVRLSKFRGNPNSTVLQAFYEAYGKPLAATTIDGFFTKNGRKADGGRRRWDASKTYGQRYVMTKVWFNYLLGVLRGLGVSMVVTDERGRPVEDFTVYGADENPAGKRQSARLQAQKQAQRDQEPLPSDDIFRPRLSMAKQDDDD